MDHRGQPRLDPRPDPRLDPRPDPRLDPRPDPRSAYRTRDREDYYRYAQPSRDQSYPPPPDPRERDGYWGKPDPRYGSHFTRPDQYLYGYGHPEPQRPQSRRGYDYPAHGHWDYRDGYGYYDQDYYRGQHGRQDASVWGPQDSPRTAPHQDNSYRQEHSGSSYPEEYRYDQGRDNAQHYLNDYEDTPSRDNEELSSYYVGTLESSKNSGLSSSCYELSQYINGAEHNESEPQPEPQPVNIADAGPLKFSIPHVVVSFGPAGQLIRVTPGLSMQENMSQLEIHSLEVILTETNEQEEMRNFPGPLTREDLHKVDAIEFAQQRAVACMSSERLQHKSSAALLWNLLVLLCRQNGQIVGSDVAELLMQGSQSDGRWESETPTLIDFSDGAEAEAPPCTGDDLLTGSGSEDSKALQSYTQLLLAGRKKEALESAMSSGLWGHALFLASKMDNRAYTGVLNRFTGQLTASDPLQTLFHLLTGRIPVVALCCGSEKWGDWRPHLAVMLANETGDPGLQQKAIVTMGDTLASKGLIQAAHVCYLTASVPFGGFTQKSERLVLLGSSHRQSFEHFATNLAIQCTELYEYCQTLGGKSLSIPSFQVYKLLYASRLLDCGLASQAFHYCEVIGRALLRLSEPLFVLTGEVIKLSDRLRHSEGQFSETGASGDGLEPDWLTQLRVRHHGLQMGIYENTETFQPRPEQVASSHQVFSESDDLNRDYQSPEPELLYYRENPEVEGITEEMNALSWDASGAPHGPLAVAPMPVTLVSAPPASVVETGQDFSYHNTDSGEVRTAHCPQSNMPSALEGAGSSSGAGTLGTQTQDLSRGQIQQQQTSEVPQQSTKTGWFSGWFTSKPKDVQSETSQHRSPAQTEVTPTTGSSPPLPPPLPPPPAMFHSSAGVNPFSRKAGQQLG